LSELRDTANEIWLSPIGTWEALLLRAKGKIRLSLDLAEWIAESTAGTREAPLTREIALAAQQLPLGCWECGTSERWRTAELLIRLCRGHSGRGPSSVRLFVCQLHKEIHYDDDHH
jgi:hypothetical protein